MWTGLQIKTMAGAWSLNHSAEATSLACLGDPDSHPLWPGTMDRATLQQQPTATAIQTRAAPAAWLGSCSRARGLVQGGCSSTAGGMVGVAEPTARHPGLTGRLRPSRAAPGGAAWSPIEQHARGCAPAAARVGAPEPGARFYPLPSLRSERGHFPHEAAPASLHARGERAHVQVAHPCLRGHRRASRRYPWHRLHSRSDRAGSPRRTHPFLAAVAALGFQLQTTSTRSPTASPPPGDDEGWVSSRRRLEPGWHREDERAFSVTLSVLGSRSSTDKGGRFAPVLLPAWPRHRQGPQPRLTLPRIRG